MRSKRNIFHYKTKNYIFAQKQKYGNKIYNVR